MSNRPIQRIAYVKLTPRGTAYPMRCEREDLGIGDRVAVLMHANSPQPHWDSGIIEHIAYQRWNCSCHVKCHSDEMRVEFDLTNGFRHTIDLSKGPRKTPEQIRREKAEATAGRHHEPEGYDLRSVYRDLAPVEGEDVYLSDGVWLRPDGSLDDRGR